LRVDPKYLDFGRVPVNDRFAWTLTIANTSSKDIVIEDIDTSCDCGSIDPKSLVIPAREAADVHFALNLTASDADTAMQHDWPFATRVIVSVKDAQLGKHNYVWEIHGEVWTPLVASPQKLVFPEGSLVRGTPFESKIVSLFSQMPLAHLTASCEKDLTQAAVAPAQSDALKYQLAIMPSTMLSVGKHDFPVRLNATSTNGTPLPATVVQVSAMVVNDVEFVPPEIRFHAAELGECLRETVVLRSRTGRTFRVLGVHCETLGLEAEQCENGQDIRVCQRVVRALTVR
jgi:hypothetical protein